MMSQVRFHHENTKSLENENEHMKQTSSFVTLGILERSDLIEAKIEPKSTLSSGLKIILSLDL